MNVELQKMLDELPQKKFAKRTDKQLEAYELLRVKKVDHLPLEECLIFVHKLKLQSTNEWEQYCLSGKKPENIPANYRLQFNNISTGEWLGTYRIADHLKEFKTIDELRQLCKDLKITSKTKWEEYWKKNKRPHDVPANPIAIYKDEIDGWMQFFSKNIRTNNTDTWSFEVARKFVRKLKLKGNAGWREYSKSGDRPIQLPGNPDKIYGKQGVWTNWKDFLGDKTMRTPNKN